MPDVVNSKLCILYAKLGALAYPIACAQDVQVETTAEPLELAQRKSTDWREFIYGRKTGSISGTGLVSVNTAPENLYNVFDLLGFQFDSLPLLVKFSMTGPDGTLKVLEADTIVERVTLSKTPGRILGHSFSLRISGPVAVSSTPVANTNPQILIYEHTATGAESDLVLSGVTESATIVVVYINGTSRRVVAFPGGYGPGEVQYNSATQTLLFGTALEAGDYVKIIYVDPENAAVIPANARDIGDGDQRVDGSGNLRTEA